MLVIAVLAAVALVAWVGVWLHPARPWDFRPVAEDEPEAPEPERWPEVAVLVPARNEAEALPHTLPRLLGQEYPGPLRVVLVDDRSDDGTGEVARRIASESGAVERLRIVAGTDLPAGWVGKMWALEQGARAAFGATESAVASGTQPGERAAEGSGNGAGRVTASDPTGHGAADGSAGAPATAGAAVAAPYASHTASVAPAGDAAYVMLTDADIAHGPRSLVRLVAESEAAALGLNSRMARLRAETPWERLLIPAFVFFFDLLYPMRKVNDPGDPLAAAAGGCVLLSRAAYEAIGGFPCIKDELIDDVNLARQVKGKGFPIRLSLSRSDVTSFRGYDTLGAIWAMVRRTAFTELRYSWLRLLGAQLGLALLFLVPVVAVVGGIGGLVAAASEVGRGWAALASAAASAGVAALLVMARVYRPATRFYGEPLRYAFALPAIAVLYMGMTLDSAIRHAFGIRSAWRGRQYGTRSPGAGAPTAAR